MSVSTNTMQALFPSRTVLIAPTSAQSFRNGTDQQSNQDTVIATNNEPCIPVTYTEKLIHFQHTATTGQILLASILPLSNGLSLTSSSATPCSEKDEVTSSSSIEASTLIDHKEHNQSMGVHLALSDAPTSSSLRLNKFVRRLHDMLQAEKDRGVVEWRRGLLVLQNTDYFAKNLLTKYFNTRNFKTFRRQLNYYGFVHVRSFSTVGSATTALWVNRELSQITDSHDIGSVLLLKRVEPCESAKTVEGRRVRKELAMSTVDDDFFTAPRKPLIAPSQPAQNVSTSNVSDVVCENNNVGLTSKSCNNQVPLEIHCPPIQASLFDYPHLSLSQSGSDSEHVCSQPASYFPRRSSCLTTTTETTIGVVSQDSTDCMSNSDEDDSTCAANLLLMLSKNGECCRMVC